MFLRHFVIRFCFHSLFLSKSDSYTHDTFHWVTHCLLLNFNSLAFLIIPCTIINNRYSFAFKFYSALLKSAGVKWRLYERVELNHLPPSYLLGIMWIISFWKTWKYGVRINVEVLMNKKYKNEAILEHTLQLFFLYMDYNLPKYL